MPNLPLAFAEILIGGILATAGVTGDTFTNIVKGEINVQPLAGASSTSSSSSSASGSSGSAASAGTSVSGTSKIGPGGVTPKSFATALLNAIGAPLSEADIQSIMDWEAREGGNWRNTASYNPLDTTEQEPGSHVMGGGNTAGVQAYSSWQQGLEATVQTLQGSDYADIVAALKSGSGFINENLQGLYTWSGHSYWSVN